MPTISVWILIITYVILPSLFYRMISNQVIKNFVDHAKKKEIALTFDDGPDAIYTPQILDLLKENDIKATFFILANKALACHEILQRMVDDGHVIGLHALHHNCSIFKLPKYERKGIQESLQIFNKLNINVKFFRPTWGIFNPVTFRYASQAKLRVVLWSLHANDWSFFRSSKGIMRIILKKVKTGDIILLHDSRGSKGAPQRTLDALRVILPELKSRGYHFITANDIV